MAHKPKAPTEQIRDDDEEGVEIFGVTVEGVGDPLGVEIEESKPWRQNPKKWREAWNVTKKGRGPYKFDDIAKGRFLAVLGQCDRVADAARAAGVSTARVYEVIREDPEFSEAFDMARQSYRDLVHRAVQIRGIEGVLQPVFNKDGDLVGYKVEYSDGLLTMEAKRVNPEFRDKQQLDLNHSGGVVAFPALPPGTTLEQLAEGYEFPEEPPDPDAPVGSEV